MSQQQNWELSRLQDYLLYDEWDKESGFRVLVGFDYDTREFRPNNNDETDYYAVPLDPSLEEQRINDYKSLVDHMRIQFNRLEDIWGKAKLRENQIHPPSYFIEWAISKKIRPPWLDWAIEHKLYVPEQEMNTNKLDAADTEKTYTFNQKSTTYPVELDLACQAWRAVSSTNGKGTPKERIKKWLANNTKISDEAKERISIVANWKKLGGATPTNK
jgi:hypothetical protein